MNPPGLRPLLRWAEIGDLPAIIALACTAGVISVVGSSCAVSTAPGPVEASSATPTSRTGSARAPGEPTVRVRIAADRESSTITGPALVSLRPERRPELSRTLRTPLVVRRHDSAWTLRDGSGATVSIPLAWPADRREGLQIRSVGESVLILDERPFAGDFVLLPSIGAPPPPGAAAASPGAGGAASPGRFDVIEHVGVEIYLEGVVSKELLRTWSLNAYKAQAIAARAYALHERERSMSLGELFDLEAGELDQAYAGSAGHPTAARAVAETRGVVLTFGGGLLRAYYSSTCGGRSASAKDVWPTTRGFEFNLAAPLQGHPREDPCHASPRFRWTVTRPKDDVTRRLAAFGRDQGLAIRGIRSISKVEMARANEYGRPSQYRVFDADGRSWTLTAEQLRTGCNWTGSSGLPAVTAQTRVYSGDAEFTVERNTVTIRGRGFGHGVGLCQYGCEAMARQGREPTQILMHYYPGARIERAY